MSNPEVNSFIEQRFLMAQTPAGRWRLRAGARAKCLAWSVARRGTSAMKRGFDCLASFAALVVLAPVFAFVAALIKLEDGGPVFFKQTRVGRFGRHFKIYKFRSMCLDAEERMKELRQQNIHGDSITFKIKNDPRITRVGKWLRKFSVDELPQFYNVLIGDMSLVGPRPPVPDEVARYTIADRRRLETMPGITCFWQIGGRAEVDFSGQVKLDVLYIERQSFWVDLKILFKTIPAVVAGRGAY